MARYSKLYLIGELGGVDGFNPIRMQIWVGDGNRQWLEPYYIDQSIKPIGVIKKIIPNGPNDPVSVLDACIAFYPHYFQKCPSLAEAVFLLGNDKTCLDFNLDPLNIPVIWKKLRKEARRYFKRLHIFEAVFVPFDLPNKTRNA